MQATQNGHSTISGIVEQLKRNDNRTALKVADKWFSTFGTCKVNEGDNVDLSYVIREKGDKVYRNIKHVEVATTTAPSTTSATDTSKDAQIARAVALKCATQWAGSVDVVRVLVAADAFYGWLQGDPVADGDYEKENVPF